MEQATGLAIPDLGVAVLAPGRKQLSVAAERDGQYGERVSSPRADETSALCIPELDRAIVHRHGKAAAVRTEGEVVDAPPGRMQRFRRRGSTALEPDIGSHCGRDHRSLRRDRDGRRRRVGYAASVGAESDVPDRAAGLKLSEKSHPIRRPDLHVTMRICDGETLPASTGC